ncbi:MAG: glycosyltransferase [Methylophilaceae bacterium]
MALQHILAPFQTASESAWLAIDLAESLRLSGETVALWSVDNPSQAFIEYGVNIIRPFQGNLPFSGHLQVIGTNVEIGSWFDHAKFDQVSVVHHQHMPASLTKLLNRLTGKGAREVLIIYTSAFLKDKTGLSGGLTLPPFNQNRVFPHGIPQRKKQGQFTIGRIGEDNLSKHHFRDIALYRKLSEAGHALKLSGATCLSRMQEIPSAVELLAELKQSESIEYLASIDCLYYCGAPNTIEGLNLWMLQAMKFGIPIIAHASGGVMDIISHEENGFLFEHQDQAFCIISELARDDALYDRISKNAAGL